MSTPPEEGASGPGGPQSPAGSRSPSSPQSPSQAGAPQSAGNASASGYSGPVPPGGWQEQGSRPPGSAGEGNTPAIAALVLGIVGIIGAFLTVGVLGVVLGIAAIVLGVKGRRKVSQGRTTEHRGIATGGLVTGIIATILGLIIIVFLAIGIALLSSSGDLQREIERQQRQLQEP